ncbi:MAG: hypothetical protein ACI4ES_15150 [Roseburia sp.]
MENYINENTVMQFYLDELDADHICFLQKRPELKASIRSTIAELMAEEKMNYKIQLATKLWKYLFEASMSSISSDKQGYDKIFKYFDSYVEFEELIFASDSFYRDHTLHCIWVYFLGEYIRRKDTFKPLFADETSMSTLYFSFLNFLEEYHIVTGDALERIKSTTDILQQLIKNDEAIRCVSALTHDLGYPLKKIEKINKSIKKVLPYFAINNFNDFNFEYENIQQEFVNNFIDFISRNYMTRLNLNNDSEAIIKKLFTFNEFGELISINKDAFEALTDEERDSLARAGELDVSFHAVVGKKNGFYNDFEDYRHGIMSAFLLCKNLRAFQNIDYNAISEKPSNLNYYSNAEILSLQSILTSISKHTSDMFKISSIDSETYLTFVDELEEFSRISRASQNREYVEEFCDTALTMKDGWFDITFEFNNTNLDNLDPELSFKGRCKRFLSLFDIEHLSPNLKIRVTVIGNLPTDQNTYVLEIADHYADIHINGESVSIPNYLKSTQFYTKEEYAAL